MYVILKQLLPAIEGPENMQYINYNVEIPGDEIYEYESLELAIAKKEELLNDPRYTGRNLKIEECQ
jgi:hypothetical protein